MWLLLLVLKWGKAVARHAWRPLVVAHHACTTPVVHMVVVVVKAKTVRLLHLVWLAACDNVGVIVVGVVMLEALAWVEAREAGRGRSSRSGEKLLKMLIL